MIGVLCRSGFFGASSEACKLSSTAIEYIASFIDRNSKEYNYMDKFLATNHDAAQLRYFRYFVKLVKKKRLVYRYSRKTVFASIISWCKSHTAHCRFFFNQLALFWGRISHFESTKLEVFVGPTRLILSVLQPLAAGGDKKKTIELVSKAADSIAEGDIIERSERATSFFLVSDPSRGTLR